MTDVGVNSNCSILILFCRGLSVCVSLFDGLAYAFHEKMTSYGAEPKVVLVTSINPKIVGGEFLPHCD